MKEQELKQEIKQGEISGLYFLTGDEVYLRDHYANMLKDKVLDPSLADFNLHYYDERTFSTQEIMDAVMSYPMMADKKVVMFHDTGILTKGESEKEFFATLFSKLPEDCVMIVCESEADKIYAPYKALQKYGKCVSFGYRNRNELKAWLTKATLKYQKTISDTDAFYLVDCCGPSMSSIRTEFEKAVSYVGARANITRADIDQTVTFSKEYKLYAFTDAVFLEKKKDAFVLLRDLRNQKESAVGIVSALGKVYGDLLMAKLLLREGTSYAQILDRLNGQDFVRKKNIERAQKVSEEYLTAVNHALFLTDKRIKSGFMEEWTALSAVTGEILTIPHR